MRASTFSTPSNTTTRRPTGSSCVSCSIRSSGKSDLDALKSGFVPLAERFGMTWTLRDPSEKRRVMLLVSKFDHCLADLLYRWRIGELDFEPAGVIANHPAETYPHVGLGDIPFHYLPVTRDTKMEQETQSLGDHPRFQDRSRGARALHAGAVGRSRREARRAAASTSTTRSCPASRAPSPITRPMRAG